MIVTISLTKDDRRRTNLRYTQGHYVRPPSIVRSQICKSEILSQMNHAEIVNSEWGGTALLLPSPFSFCLPCSILPYNPAAGNSLPHSPSIPTACYNQETADGGRQTAAAAKFRYIRVLSLDSPAKMGNPPAKAQSGVLSLSKGRGEIQGRNPSLSAFICGSKDFFTRLISFLCRTETLCQRVHLSL